MVPGNTESSRGNKWMFVMSKGRGGKKTQKAAGGHKFWHERKLVSVL